MTATETEVKMRIPRKDGPGTQIYVSPARWFLQQLMSLLTGFLVWAAFTGMIVLAHKYLGGG